MKHVIIVRESDDEVFWLESFNLEAIMWKVEAICDPATNIWQRDVQLPMTVTNARSSVRSSASISSKR
jgi:hypothetical protein